MASKKKAKTTKAATTGEVACKRKFEGQTCGAVNPAAAAFCHHCKGDPKNAVEQ